LIQNLELSLLLMNEDKRKKEESEKHFFSLNDNKAEDAEKLLNIMFSGEDLFWTEDAAGKKERGKDW
jgi:hypothetical protein